MLRRARQPKQKEERRGVILEAARCFLAEASFRDVTMAEIAARAKLAKGTLYLYFQTKEELFLVLLETELEDWYAEMGDLLDGAVPMSSTESFRPLTEVAATLLSKRPTLRRLLSIMGSILEQNITFERALQFKEKVAGLAENAGKKLETVLAFLQPGEGVYVIERLYAIAMGLQQLSEPGPVMKRALEQPHLEKYRMEFQREFAETACWYLTGMAARAQTY